LSRPFTPRNISPAAFIRVNGKIRARDVRVIGVDNKQIGIISLNEALGLARTHGVDLVEISPNAVPPVCRLVDFGKYRYELSKKDKDSKKRQNASLVKEVQLSPRIDPHDLSIKTDHAIGFLCEDMKVKIALKFRGREMAHTEVGFEVINKFVASIAAYGHPDFQPKLVGRAINLMISPLPRAKRRRRRTGARIRPGRAGEKNRSVHCPRCARCARCARRVRRAGGHPAGRGKSSRGRSPVCQRLEHPLHQLGHQIAGGSRQLCTRSGNRQSAQTAFVCSQKSRTICNRPCCAAAPSKTPARVVPSSRCRASFKTELSSAAGHAKNRRSTSRWNFSLPPSLARIHSHGSTPFTARSVTRAAPSSGCGRASRADLNVQCQDQNSSASI